MAHAGLFDVHRALIGPALESGQKEAARRHAERSIEYAEKLTRVKPNNRLARWRLASAKLSAGKLALEEWRDFAEARRLFEEALKLMEELVEADPGDTDILVELVDSHLSMARLAKAQECEEEVLEQARAALKASRRALELQPHNPRLVEQHEHVHEMVARLQAKAERK